MEKDERGKKASNPWGKVSGDRSVGSFSEDAWPLPSLPKPGETKHGRIKVNTATAQNAHSGDNIITGARSDSEQLLAESDLQQHNSFMINPTEQNSDLQSEEIISSAAQEIPISSRNPTTGSTAHSNESQVEVSRQVSEAATDNIIITGARSDSEQLLPELDLQQQSFNSDLQSEARDQNREIISSHNGRNAEARSGYQVSMEVVESILNPRWDHQHLSFFSGRGRIYSMGQSSALQSAQNMNISSAAQQPEEENNLAEAVPSSTAQIWSLPDPYPQRPNLWSLPDPYPQRPNRKGK